MPELLVYVGIRSTETEAIQTSIPQYTTSFADKGHTLKRNKSGGNAI
jgi:hypothetical protein